MLKAIRDGLVKRRLKAPEVRCWPHHFDMDSLIQLGGNRAVGSGFCPGDEFCDEPYFYISIYPEPYIPALPLLPPVGHWRSYKFIAALAPAHKIVASLDQPRDIAGFFDISINAALEAQPNRAGRLSSIALKIVASGREVRHDRLADQSRFCRPGRG